MDLRKEKSKCSLPADSHKPLISHSELEKNKSHLLLARHFNPLNDSHPFVSPLSLHCEDLNCSKIQNNIINNNCKNKKIPNLSAMDKFSTVCVEKPSVKSN